MDDDPLQRELEQMSGSPAIARQLKESLRRLSSGAAGPGLAEMAGELLDGRTDLRTVARSSAYAQHITEAVGRFRQWHAELTPEERERLLEEMRGHLREPR